MGGIACILFSVFSYDPVCGVIYAAIPCSLMENSAIQWQVAAEWNFSICVAEQLHTESPVLTDLFSYFLTLSMLTYLCRLRWIFQQPMMIKRCFNFLNISLVAIEYLLSINISLHDKKIVLQVLADVAWNEVLVYRIHRGGERCRLVLTLIPSKIGVQCLWMKSAGSGWSSPISRLACSAFPPSKMTKHSLVVNSSSGRKKAGPPAISCGVKQRYDKHGKQATGGPTETTGGWRRPSGSLLLHVIGGLNE